MGKVFWAALTAAAALACAGQASATLMQATVVGSYDPVSLGQAPTYQPLNGGWQATFVYETDFGTVTDVTDGQRLSWSSASGAPSLLVSMTYDAGLTNGATFNYALTDVTSFSITRTTHGTLFQLTAPGFLISQGNANPMLNRAIDQDTSFDTAYFYGHPDVGVSGQLTTPDLWGSPYTDAIIIERAPIPEPATWGLLILGFGGVGAVLRQRRRQAPVIRRAATA